jgi:hypothetical protein
MCPDKGWGEGEASVADTACDSLPAGPACPCFCLIPLTTWSIYCEELLITKLVVPRAKTGYSCLSVTSSAQKYTAVSLLN